jgi:hypothetical protein
MCEREIRNLGYYHAARNGCVIINTYFRIRHMFMDHLQILQNAWLGSMRNLKDYSVDALVVEFIFAYVIPIA